MQWESLKKVKNTILISQKHNKKGERMATEKLTREEADNLLESWADYLELDTDRQLYTDIVDELRLPVRKEKLTFDMEEEVFQYQLIKPVDDIQIVEIKECSFKEKKVIQRYKKNESIDSAGAMLSKYTNLSIEQVDKLKDRDVNKINAVVLGFLAQVAPGEN